MFVVRRLCVGLIAVVRCLSFVGVSMSVAVRCAVFIVVVVNGCWTFADVLRCSLCAVCYSLLVVRCVLFIVCCSLCVVRGLLLVG